ncbi:hypothetical protein [Paracoccus shanxieyensis]|uniref:Lipoprotein n=1 Tax=Paracoccus shanxieyensis TaxID=2675752 RepID=A0A6L6IXY8_9RHOB|nr:hypothetical protein [Paracoccus shanxieyensis]MTH63454.1 hypothetical protein [Paracoccus shanxieyensis]MTH86375.1 hypothetical protein [Paracoccus shanxieyensis]
MRFRTLGYLCVAGLVLTGCGRFGSDSGLNPLGWFGGNSQPQTLEPEGGYVTVTQDLRQPLAQITGARWEPLYEGRMLVVTGLGNSKGWWDVALVTEMAMPSGRIRPDQNGVLRLRLVGNPPAPQSAAARSAVNPASDTITTALTLSHEAMAGLTQVVITGAGNSVTLRP